MIRNTWSWASGCNFDRLTENSTLNNKRDFAVLGNKKKDLYEFRDAFSLKLNFNISKLGSWVWKKWLRTIKLTFCQKIKHVCCIFLCQASNTFFWHNSERHCVHFDQLQMHFVYSSSFGRAKRRYGKVTEWNWSFFSNSLTLVVVISLLFYAHLYKQHYPDIPKDITLDFTR